MVRALISKKIDREKSGVELVSRDREAPTHGATSSFKVEQKDFKLLKMVSNINEITRLALSLVKIHCYRN